MDRRSWVWQTAGSKAGARIDRERPTWPIHDCNGLREEIVDACFSCMDGMRRESSNGRCGGVKRSRSCQYDAGTFATLVEKAAQYVCEPWPDSSGSAPIVRYTPIIEAPGQGWNLFMT